MDEVLTASEKQVLVASFLEIAVDQSMETARQFLQATSWHLEEAIQLFLVGNESGGQHLPSAASPPAERRSSPVVQDVVDVVSENRRENGVQEAADDGVRAPLPVIREVLYDDPAMHAMARQGYPHVSQSVIAFRNFEEESRRSGVWESGQATSSTMPEVSRDNLASLYRPPFSLMYAGSFDQAKVEASAHGKWLLVNLQSPKEFSSHTLNRDTWGNEAVAQTVKSNFIFWQVYDESSEGKKVCTYYNLHEIPAILVIDPITGQKMRSWTGMVDAERLLEDLLPYMDKTPKDYYGHPHSKRRKGSPPAPSHMSLDDATEDDEELLRALAVSMEGRFQASSPPEDGNMLGKHQSTEQEGEASGKEESALVTNPVYPPLPEEAKGDRNLLCRVGVRLPNGQRIQRNFLRTDSTQLLWSFCYAHLKEEERNKPFRLTEAIPGASRTLDFHTDQTLEEAKLSNAMLSLAWE